MKKALKKNGTGNGHGNGHNGNGNGADYSAFSDQIGYRVVQVGETERVQPINPKRQARFEAAAAQLRQI